MNEPLKFLNLMRSLSFLVAFVLTATVTQGQNSVDKRQYHLFHPVPDNQLRELSTDRPDITESPYTVDPGHFQVEADLFKYTYDNAPGGVRGTKFEGYVVPSVNFKVGLLYNTDLQVVVDPYVHERFTDATGNVTERDGFGDLVTRLKINLWGNDEGSTGLGIMPFLKAPTASAGLGNDSVEGGIIVPFAIALPAGWDLGLMAEFDFLKEENGGYTTEIVNSIAAGHTIVGPLGGYLEFVSITPTSSGGDWQGLVGTGLTYACNENLQLDAGANIGVNDASPDITSFVGISWRY